MRRVLSVLAVAAVMAGLLWAGFWSLQKEYVFWNGMLLSRQARELDISGRRMGDLQAFLELGELRLLDARDTGMTAAQYEWFRRELPECQVLWQVPIQGQALNPDTRELYIEALTPEEMDSLVYLPDLELLDLGGWEDYSRIRELKQRYPDCTIRHRITIAGERWESHAPSLLIKDASPAELMEKLAYFDELQSVLLTGQIPAFSDMQKLQAKYPQVFFLWKLHALGRELETDLETLDLPDGSLTRVEELEELLPYLPRLKTLRLSSLGLDQDKLVALVKQYPGIRFQFEVNLAGHSLSTDAEEIDISNTPLESTAAIEALLPCFPDLKKVVMCNCGLDSQTMDALNQKYENIRFVWSVELGGKSFRTDAVHFTPNRWGLKLNDDNIQDLQYCTDMVCVDIGHNMDVTHCQWVRNMPKLKYLVLAETGISDLSPLENHENLVFLEIFLSKVKDYSPLVTCKALEDLNLCYTQGDPAPIAEMTWLKRLWWSGSWLGRTTLADKLPDTEAQYLSLSSTGKGWREGQHYYDMRDFIGMEYMTG